MFIKFFIKKNYNFLNKISKNDKTMIIIILGIMLKKYFVSKNYKR